MLTSFTVKHNKTGHYNSELQKFLQGQLMPLSIRNPKMQFEGGACFLYFSHLSLVLLLKLLDLDSKHTKHCKNVKN